VEFGLELSAEAGAFIVVASSTADFKVPLRGRRSRPPTTGDSVNVADGG
jgi:Trypsin-co-occurring domain 1